MEKDPISLSFVLEVIVQFEKLQASERFPLAKPVVCSDRTSLPQLISNFSCIRDTNTNLMLEMSSEA